MRISLANSLCYRAPGGGGGERIALWLCEALARRGVDVEAIAIDHPEAFDVPSYCRRLLRPQGDPRRGRRPGLGSRILRAVQARIEYRRMLRHYRAHRPDLVLLGSIVNMNPAPLWAARALGIPVVWWVLAEREIDLLEESHARLHRAVFRATGAPDPAIPLDRAFAAIVPCSRFLLDSAHAHGAHAPIERVVPHGVPTEMYRPGRPQFPPRRILWVGRLTEGKGYEDALRAFSLLAPKFPGLSLTVVGSSDEGRRRRAETIARELGVASSVSFLGYVSEDHTAYRNHDLFWFTSRLPEGLPLTLLQALAAGLPVVATKVGAVPEAITDGVEGFEVPPHDPAALAGRTERILREPDVARVMSEASRRRALSDFSLERMALNFFELLREVKEK